MKMGKGAALRFFAVSAIFLFVGKVALASAQTPSLPTSKDLQANEISIPPSLGYVLETHPSTSTTTAHAPILVHIQEAHTNYEAQRNIVQILEQLIHEHGLKLILVEGSEGDVSLTYLRKHGTPERRRQVAEKYLKAGIISGEEYLDLTSDYPLKLWGVEQQELYDQNLEAFLAAEEMHEALAPVVASVREAADLLAPHLSDPSLTDLEAKAKAFEQHQLSLTDYAQALNRVAKEHGVSLSGHPNLERFLEAAELERQIDTSKVQQEQHVLIGTLSEVASDAELEELIAAANGMKAGTVKPVDFYTTLQRIASNTNISLDHTPTLSHYIRYIKRSTDVNPTLLSDELDACWAQLRVQLSSTPERQQMTRITEGVDLFEKLLDFKLSPQEYQRLTTLDLSASMPQWEAFLNEHLARHKLPTRSFAQLSAMQEQLASLKRFYEVAGQRDEVLVNNAVEKLQESGERIAVLITGGFHAPRMTELLKAKEVGTVVVTPKVSHPTDERLYRAVVKYKSGRGSYDDVMAIAGEQQESVSSRQEAVGSKQ